MKTDRRDVPALAEACVLGAYRRAHGVSDSQRHVRGQLGVRDAVVRTRTRYVALSRARRRQEGWRVPTGTAEGFSRRVLALPLPGRLRSEVAPLLAVMPPPHPRSRRREGSGGRRQLGIFTRTGSVSRVGDRRRPAAE